MSGKKIHCFYPGLKSFFYLFFFSHRFVLVMSCQRKQLNSEVSQAIENPFGSKLTKSSDYITFRDEKPEGWKVLHFVTVDRKHSICRFPIDEDDHLCGKRGTQLLLPVATPLNPQWICGLCRDGYKSKASSLVHIRREHFW